MNKFKKGDLLIHKNKVWKTIIIAFCDGIYRYSWIDSSLICIDVHQTHQIDMNMTLYTDIFQEEI